MLANRRKKQKGLFDDYEGFVEKFKPKKTTDDCYTPPAVYDYVLQYVADHCDIDGMTVVRPFFLCGVFVCLVGRLFCGNVVDRCQLVLSVW